MPNGQSGRVAGKHVGVPSCGTYVYAVSKLQEMRVGLTMPPVGLRGASTNKGSMGGANRLEGNSFPAKSLGGLAAILSRAGPDSVGNRAPAHACDVAWCLAASSLGKRFWLQNKANRRRGDSLTTV